MKMKTERVDLLKSVREMLKRPHLNPPQVAGLGEEIFILKKIFNIDGKQYRDFFNEYMKIVSKLNLHDLLERQIRYAVRLAGNSEELIYEDMFKLFCLCDEIVGLKGLGFEVEESLNIELKKALKNRFKKRSKESKACS